MGPKQEEEIFLPAQEEKILSPAQEEEIVLPTQEEEILLPTVTGDAVTGDVKNIRCRVTQAQSSPGRLEGTPSATLPHCACP